MCITRFNESKTRQIAINFTDIYSQCQCLSHAWAINGYYDTKPASALFGDTDCFIVSTAVLES